MKKIIIIEDEVHTSRQLKKHILDYNKSLEVIAELTSVEDALDYFKHHEEPDLLFSDIELNDGVCFQIFEKHPIKCPIIFTTAYDDYWQKAFDTNSIDYLLKPINKKKLHKSLDKLNEVESFYKDHQASLKTLLNTFKQRNSYKDRLLIKVGNHYHVIETKNIAYVYSEDKVSTVVSQQNRQHFTYDSLDQLEQVFDPNYFFRANRKFLIHISSIYKIHTFFKGRLQVHLKPCEKEFLKITISQAKVKTFKEWIESRVRA